MIVKKVLEDLNNLFSALDQAEYNRRLRKIKVTIKDIKSSIENFPVTLVGSLDPQSIESERRAIADSMKVFISKVSNLEADLEDNNNEVYGDRLAN